jgi:molybdopterin-guanine dinucleotide biosynthesis protein B
VTPVISIVGYAKSGKTQLIEGLLPELGSRGFKVAVIKHDDHGACLEDIDREGKDTYRHKKAGAAISILASPDKFVLFKKTEDPIPLLKIINNYCCDVDLVITEGYKKEDFPKIEVAKERFLCTEDDNLIAIVCEKDTGIDVPHFAPGEYQAIASFICDRFIKEEKEEVYLSVDDRKIHLNGFASSMIKETVLGLVAPLKGVSSEAKEIVININRGGDA